MNLTYEDYCYSSPERASRERRQFVAMHQVAKKAGVTKNAQGTQLAGFFSDIGNTLKSSLIRTNLFPVTLTKALVSGGPSGALQAVKNEGHAAAGDFSKLGPIVTPIAGAINPLVGAAVGAVTTAAKVDVAKQQQRASALNAAGNDQQLNAAYKQVARTVPGRAIGPDALKQVLGAFVRMGGFPPIRVDQEPNSPASRTAWENAQKAAAQSLARGDYSAVNAFNNDFKQIAASTPGQQWMIGQYVTAPGSDDNFQSQIFVDMIDAAMAQMNPNVPYSYGVQSSDYVQAPTPTTVSAPSMPTTVSAPLPAPTQSVQTPQPIAYAPPNPQPLQQVGVDPATQAQINAMLQSMQQQGANQQQMYAAMMSQLANAGVNTQAPQVQQAAAATLQPMTAGLSGNTSLWIAGGLAVLAVMFALARPAPGKK